MPLPLNYELQPGTVLCPATVAALTVNARSSGDAVLTVSDNLDPAFIRPAGGASSIKFDVTGGGTVTTLWNLDWIINTSLAGVARFHLPYWTNNIGALWNITAFVSELSTYANRFNYSPYTIAPNAARLGWNLATMDRNRPSSTTGVPSIGNTFTRIRLQLQVPAGKTGTLYLGPLSINRHNRPKIVFSFDDQDASQYSEGFAYLNARNLVGSACVQTSIIDGGSGVTLANLQEMRAAGWSFHNHSVNHPNLTGLSITDASAHMRQAQNWLDDKGFRYGRGTVVYPNGATNDAVDEAMQALGYRFGCITRGQVEKYWDGLAFPMRIDRQATDVGVSLSTLTSRVDDAITFGGGVVFYTHAISGGATGSNTLTTTWRGLVDYVKRFHDANVLDVVTLQGFIDGLSGARPRRT